MCENKAIYSKEKKEKDIKKEVSRLNKFYKKCEKKDLDFARPLIENAAFMKVTLEDLRENINLNGAVCEYKNGENQYGTKKSPEAELYTTMQKNYAALMKQLADMIPKPEAWEVERDRKEDDGFDEFVNER